MKRKPHRKSEPAQALRISAMQYPEAQERIACEGTSLEKRTIKARSKAFLFLGAADAMLKLRESLAEATDLASQEPSRYKVGAHGWVTVTFGNDGRPTSDATDTAKKTAAKKKRG